MSYLAFLLLAAATMHAMEFPGYPNKDFEEIKEPSNPCFYLEEVISAFQQTGDLFIKEIDQKTDLLVCFSEKEKDFYINCLDGNTSHLHIGKLLHAHFDHDYFLIAKKYKDQSKISYVSCKDLKEFLTNLDCSQLEFSFTFASEVFSVKQVGFSPKHQKLFVLDDKGKLKYYYLKNPSNIQYIRLSIPGDQEKVKFFTISPDETYLAVIFQDNRIIIYNIERTIFPDLHKDVHYCKISFNVNNALWSNHNKLILLQSFTHGLSKQCIKLEAGYLSSDLTLYRSMFTHVAQEEQELLGGVMSGDGVYFVFLHKKRAMHAFTIHIYKGHTFHPHATIDCKNFCQSLDISIDKLAFDAKNRLTIVTNENLYYVNLDLLTVDSTAKKN